MDIEGLLDHKEPESAQDAINKYAHILLPERNIESTISRLLPLVGDSTFADKVADANKKNKSQMEETEEEEGASSDLMVQNNPMLSQVIGILIGSPEFQRK